MVKKYNHSGGFVLYSDYEKLEAENSVLKSEKSVLHSNMAGLKECIERLKSENGDLKKKLQVENPDQTAGPRQNGHIPDAGKMVEVGQVWGHKSLPALKMITEFENDFFCLGDDTWLSKAEILQNKEWRLIRHADGRLVEVVE